jgi:hypothetical protein
MKFFSFSSFVLVVVLSRPAFLQCAPSDTQIVDSQEQDQFISTREYRQSQKQEKSSNGNKRNDDDLEGEADTITVKMKDGTMKKMLKDDLMKEMKDRTEGFRKTKENNVVKEENSKISLSNIEKENPGLNKMIKLGNASFEILKFMNHTNGKLVRIQTLKDPEIKRQIEEEEDEEQKNVEESTKKEGGTGPDHNKRKEDEVDEDTVINYHKAKIQSNKGLMVSFSTM